MDKHISQGIATGIIRKILLEPQNWSKSKDSAGDIISNGEFIIHIDNQEVSCSGLGSAEWRVIPLEPSDVERIFDIAYEICHEREGFVSESRAIADALRVIELVPEGY